MGPEGWVAEPSIGCEISSGPAFAGVVATLPGEEPAAPKVFRHFFIEYEDVNHPLMLQCTRMRQLTFYGILGLPEKCAMDPDNKRLMTSEYRRLSRECHPDKVVDDELKKLATELQTCLNTAYHTLSDPTLKCRYDSTLHGDRHMTGLDVAAMALGFAFVLAGIIIILVGVPAGAVIASGLIGGGLNVCSMYVQGRRNVAPAELLTTFAIGAISGAVVGGIHPHLVSAIVLCGAGTSGGARVLQTTVEQLAIRGRLGHFFNDPRWAIERIDGRDAYFREGVRIAGATLTGALCSYVVHCGLIPVNTQLDNLISRKVSQTLARRISAAIAKKACATVSSAAICAFFGAGTQLLIQCRQERRTWSCNWKTAITNAAKTGLLDFAVSSFLVSAVDITAVDLDAVDGDSDKPVMVDKKPAKVDIEANADRDEDLERLDRKLEVALKEFDTCPDEDKLVRFEERDIAGKDFEAWAKGFLRETAFRLAIDGFSSAEGGERAPILGIPITNRCRHQLGPVVVEVRGAFIMDKETVNGNFEMHDHYQILTINIENSLLKSLEGADISGNEGLVVLLMLKDHGVQNSQDLLEFDSKDELPPDMKPISKKKLWRFIEGQKTSAAATSSSSLVTGADVKVTVFLFAAAFAVLSQTKLRRLWQIACSVMHRVPMYRAIFH